MPCSSCTSKSLFLENIALNTIITGAPQVETGQQPINTGSITSHVIFQFVSFKTSFCDKLIYLFLFLSCDRMYEIYFVVHTLYFLIFRLINLYLNYLTAPWKVQPICNLAK